MGAILNSADDISVHTITIIARIVGRNEIAVAVRLSVQDATELSTTGNGRRRAGQIVSVTIVTYRTADAIEQDGRTSFDL
jgi:hypothetical protein